MKYIHKPIEVEAIKFTETVAKDRMTFSQFGIEDRADNPHSWSYWKTPESLKTPGRFYLRTHQHSTVMVAIGDWLVKETESGYVTIMNEVRFNAMYRPSFVKSPPQEDWREVIKTSGLSYDKIKEAYAKVLPRLKDTEDGLLGRKYIEPLPGVTTTMLQEHFAKQARELDEQLMSQFNEGPPSAIGAIMADEYKKIEQEFKKQRDDYIDSTAAYMKGAHYDVHRTDSTDRETGPTDCRDCGPCEGCKGDK